MEAVKCPVCGKNNDSVEGWFYESQNTDERGTIEYTYYCECGCEYKLSKNYEVKSASIEIDFDPRELDDESEAE